MKRTRLEILRDILEIIKKSGNRGIAKSRLSQKSNCSSFQSKEFLDICFENKLIRSKELEEGTTLLFLEPNGKVLLDKLNDMLNRFRLLNGIKLFK